MHAEGAVHETLGNRNNLIGLPQTLLRLPGTASFCVLELGMSGSRRHLSVANVFPPNIPKQTHAHRD